MSATIISKDEALTITGHRRKDRNAALDFLNDNSETFRNWATDPDRKSGHEFKGHIRLHSNDTIGQDIIKKAFTDSGWTCEVEMTTELDQPGLADFDVIVKF